MKIKPDWNQIEEQLDQNASREEANSFWVEQCHSWLQDIQDHYKGEYRIHETSNFYLLSDESDRYNEIFSDYLELTLKRILSTLKGIAADDGFGKHVSIVFANQDHYYNYVSLFFPDEGDFGLSSGMYINDGYGHFAFPTQDITYAEPIAVHELTHACLAHLPIPTWLNEGLAVTMEEKLAGMPFHLDNELFAEHQAYWNQSTIQDFWSGNSFFASDEGQELSYSLAQVLVRKLTSDYDSFVGFTNAATFEDGGAKATEDHFGFSLQNIVESFLGDGEWAPSRELNKYINANAPTARGRHFASQNAARYIWHYAQS